MSCDDLQGSVDISLEYDDYPLDLVSPIARETYHDPESGLGILGNQDSFKLHEKSPLHNFNRGEIFGNNDLKLGDLGSLDTGLDEDEEDPDLAETPTVPYRVWRLQDLSPRRINEKDRLITDEIITDFGRRSYCDYDLEDKDEVGQVTATVLPVCPNSKKHPVLNGKAPTVRDSSMNKGGEDEEQHYQRKSCLVGCTHWCQESCKPCLIKYHPLPEKDTWKDRLVYAMRCPPHGTVARLLAAVVVMATVWAVLWAVTHSQALPGGNFFSLVIVFISAYTAGAAIVCLRLPSFVGNDDHVMVTSLLTMCGGEYDTNTSITMTSHLTPAYSLM